jgi:hypothetical protein
MLKNELDNQGKIIEAGWQGDRSARKMVKEMISLGADPTQVKNAIDHLAEEATVEAQLCFSQKQ